MDRLPKAPIVEEYTNEQERQRKQNEAVMAKYPKAYRKMTDALVDHFLRFKQMHDEIEAANRQNGPPTRGVKLYRCPDVGLVCPEPVRHCYPARDHLVQAVHDEFLKTMTMNGFNITQLSGLRYNSFDRDTKEFVNGTPYIEYEITNLHG